MTDRTRRSWIPSLMALIGGGVIVAGSFLTWLKVPGGVSVETVSVPGTPKGSELLLGQVAIGAGAAVIILGLLLPVIRRARRLLGFLVIVGGAVAIAVAYSATSSPRDRYIDFAVQKGPPAGHSDEVRASLANLFEVSGQEVDLGVGLYVVIGGGALSVLGGLGALLGRRKAKPVEEAAELPEPDRLAKEWLAAREQEAAARSAAFEEPPEPELVTQPAGPSASTQPPEPDLVTESVRPPRMTQQARRSWLSGLLALIGGGAIVAGCLLTWLHVGGGVSVGSVSITGTPKGNELLTGKEALVDGIAVVFFALLLLLNRGVRTLLGLLVVVGGIIAVAIGAYVASSPRDRYIDFAVQQGALAGQTDEVNRSLVHLFDVSGQEADLGVGLFVVIGGGVLSVVGGLTVVTDRRKPTSVDEVHEPSGPEPEGLPEEWLAARAQEAAARSAVLEESPTPELVTRPAGPPPPTQPPEPEPVTQLAGPPPMPKAPEPELVSQPAGPPPPTEPQEPELVTQAAGSPPSEDRPKPDVRAAWTKPLPAEWAAKAPSKGRRRRRS